MMGEKRTSYQRAWCGFCAVATPVCVGLLLGSAGSLKYKGTAGSSLDRCTFRPTDAAYEYPGQPGAQDTPAYSALFEDVCIHGGTERAKEYQPAVPQPNRTYTCACCGEELFAGEDKFDSRTGWPSFSAPIGPGAIGYARDGVFTSTEVHCASCGAHLGHVFTDGPAPSGLRYCIDGVCLRKVGARRAFGRAYRGDPLVLPDMLGLVLLAVGFVAGPLVLCYCGRDVGLGLGLWRGAPTEGACGASERAPPPRAAASLPPPTAPPGARPRLAIGLQPENRDWAGDHVRVACA